MPNVLMRHPRELDALGAPVVLALGVFDGVHIGHQAVLRAAARWAAGGRAVAVPLTFDPHPRHFLTGEGQPPRLLTNLPHKRLILERLGFPHVLALPFNAHLAAMPAEGFLDFILSHGPPIHGIVTGFDFRFGHCRGGDSQLLEEIAAGRGFGFEAIEPVRVGGERVSSTRIREVVAAGELDLCEPWLGRPYTVFGVVSQGRRLGRRIGFPTANVEPACEQLPPDGVYAVETRIEGQGEPLGGVANLGMRPTVCENEKQRRLEVHLFDFEGDLYGRSLETRFLRHLRGERSFDGIDQLKAAIAADAEAARRVLAGG